MFPLLFFLKLLILTIINNTSNTKQANNVLLGLFYRIFLVIHPGRVPLLINGWLNLLSTYPTCGIFLYQKFLMPKLHIKQNNID